MKVSTAKPNWVIFGTHKWKVSVRAGLSHIDFWDYYRSRSVIAPYWEFIAIDLLWILRIRIEWPGATEVSA